MDASFATYRIHQCSKCPADTEYSCQSCLSYLCHQCKENHVKDLETAEHNVVSYCDKLNYIPTQDNCLKHPCNAYSKYCESCHVPVCDFCSEHKSHSFRSIFSWKRIILNEQSDYTRKRQQYICTIHTIKSETLFRIPFILQGIKSDVKNCHKKSLVYHSEITKKAKRLKHLINKVLYDLLNNVFCDFDFKHRYLKQKLEISSHIVSLQGYEHSYIQPASTFSALQFLLSMKTALPEIRLTLIHTSKRSMTEPLVKENVMESLNRMEIAKKERNRRVGNECLLKLMPSIRLHKHLRLRRMLDCYHISCLTSDRVCVSDRRGTLVLISTTGDSLHYQTNANSYGCHTLNGKNELIFVHSDHTIKMLSEKMNTPKTIFKTKDKTWRPQCVYWSPSTADLLVGMYKKKSKRGKVIRYNQSRKQTKTIPGDNTEMNLFIKPIYITQNNNGDVVVSDSGGAVVVTERGGRHRFSYTGHPPGSGLRPRGICTDALSHILMCDGRTNTVQMIDKDGHFLSHLLIRPLGIFKPLGLSYDARNHRLLIGSWYNNKVCVYSYISRQDALGDQSTTTLNDVVSLRENQTTGTEKQEQEHGCPLKNDTSKSFEVTDINNCYHISCVTSDRVWVSDSDNNLILTDTTGVPLHRVEDFSYDLCGSYTVNSESELIYINKNYKIIKLMNDLNSTNTFFTQNTSTWKPRCLYWSLTTGELLVGSYRDKLTHPGIPNEARFNQTGKVIRYNQSGQLAQTMQYDGTGLELYREPNYITENNNGDVVVSDDDAVVVTERGGRHRFSYTGHPSGSRLRPRGICTDALSHILVCDVTTSTIHIIDMDGNFLSHFLTNSENMDDPHSLSYNTTTDHLWVGSLSDKKLCVYRYISRQNTPKEVKEIDGSCADESDGEMDYQTDKDSLHNKSAQEKRKAPSDGRSTDENSAGKRHKTQEKTMESI